MKQFQSKSKK